MGDLRGVKLIHKNLRAIKTYVWILRGVKNLLAFFLLCQEARKRAILEHLAMVNKKGKRHSEIWDHLCEPFLQKWCGKKGGKSRMRISNLISFFKHGEGKGRG